MRRNLALVLLSEVHFSPPPESLLLLRLLLRFFFNTAQHTLPPLRQPPPPASPTPPRIICGCDARLPWAHYLATVVHTPPSYTHIRITTLFESRCSATRLLDRLLATHPLPVNQLIALPAAVMDQGPQSPGARSHGSRTFSFRSDKSGGSKPKEDLHDSPKDKQRRDSIWKATSKANPNAALAEAQPGGASLCLSFFP